MAVEAANIILEHVAPGLPATALSLSCPLIIWFGRRERFSSITGGAYEQDAQCVYSGFFL
jgi:hypothetical protein